MTPWASPLRRGRASATPTSARSESAGALIGPATTDALEAAAQRIAAAADTAAALAVLVDCTLGLLGVEGVAVADLESHDFRVAIGAGSLAPMVGFHAPLGGSVVADVLASGRPLLVRDAERDARVASLFLSAFAPRDLAIAPLVVEHRVRGVLVALNAAHGGFRDVDLAILQRLADLGASAVSVSSSFIESAPSHPDAAQLARHARVLASAARLMAAGGTPETVFAGIFRIAETELLAHGISVYLADPATRRVDLAHSAGAGSQIIEWTAERFWSMPAGRVTLTGIPWFASDIADGYSALSLDEVSAFRASGLQSMALLPLITDGPERGVLALRFMAPQRFTEPERRMLEDFATQVVVAIQNARLTEAERTARERERTLTEAMHQSEKLAAIGELVAGVAHELNNPLTGISTFAQLLLDDTLSTDQRESVSEIKREADRAVAVIRDLLSFSRKTGPRLVPVDLNTLVQHTLRLRAYSLQSSGVEVQTALDPELPAIVGDDQKLQQVLLNLVVNAEYAMHRSARRALVVRTEQRIDGSVPWVAVHVQDSGVGMAPEIQKHIFEPFFTTKPAGVGTGLGLSVSYGIVQAHGGRIDVDTALGTGSTFTVLLPPQGRASSSGTRPLDPRPAHDTASTAAPSHRRAASHSESPRDG